MAKLIYSLFITIFILYIFISTPSVLTKIIMIPFLICALATVIKMIFLIMNKKKYAEIFNKIYIISFLFYWFGFIIYWCYIEFINKSYLMLLFALPFLLIGIYIAYKYLFKRKSNISKNKENVSKFKSKLKYNFNFKIIIGILLIVICLVSGLIMLFLGITDTYKVNKIVKDYITTDGYFSRYDIYNSDEDGTTYKLTYTYKVDGIEYRVTTDYGTSYIPEESSIRQVKYNPENPEEAILVGTNSKNSLIFFGGFFTLVPIVFILAIISSFGYFNKFKIDIIGTYIGVVFLTIRIGSIWLQYGTKGALIESMKSLGFWLLIPIVFIVTGIFQIVKSLFLIKMRR